MATTTEVTPESMESLRKMSPNDYKLEVAMSDWKEPLIFSMLKKGAMNDFDTALAETYLEDGRALEGTVEPVPQKLKEVLKRRPEVGLRVDLIDVDAEGEDLGVLKSNDWSGYCPAIAIIQELDTPLARLHENPAAAFLKDKGFVTMSRMFDSIIFRQVSSVCAAS